jgi:glycosyltransferase involved in cell wall biosynthesis
MKPVIVTAIVSTYNSRHLISGCLEDLFRQTIAPNLEIIVIDSASETMDYEAVIEMQHLHPRLLCLRTSRRETSHASINRAIRLATGRYVTLANTDDRHRKDALEQMMAALDAQPDVALAYADTLRTNVLNETYEQAAALNRPIVQWPDFRVDRLFGNARIGPQPMWRRSLHTEIGFFDESIVCAGDYDFWLRIVARTEYRLYHVNQVLGLWYDSPTTMSQANPKLISEEVAAIRQRYRDELIRAGKLPNIGTPLTSELTVLRRFFTGKRLALFGAGDLGAQALDILKHQGEQVVAFLDNYKAKHGTILRSIPILDPAKAIQEGIADFILITSMYWSEITNQLECLGLHKDADFAVCHC